MSESIDKNLLPSSVSDTMDDSTDSSIKDNHLNSRLESNKINPIHVENEKKYDEIPKESLFIDKQILPQIDIEQCMRDSKRVLKEDIEKSKKNNMVQWTLLYFCYITQPFFPDYTPEMTKDEFIYSELKEDEIQLYHSNKIFYNCLNTLWVFFILDITIFIIFKYYIFVLLSVSFIIHAIVCLPIITFCLDLADQPNLYISISFTLCHIIEFILMVTVYNKGFNLTYKDVKTVYFTHVYLHLAKKEYRKQRFNYIKEQSNFV
ncbi:hypothetical protein WA158_000016 [Blastocystis sp. Blastoise]